MSLSMPTAEPNYDSVRPGSAWWLQKTAGATRTIVATTGYAFVTELQRKLRQYFSSSAHRASSWEAYGGGRGDVAETTITGLDTLTADGNWGPKTNAGLWLWLKDKRDGTSDANVQHAIQNLMDNVELVQIQHTINLLTLRAAAWLVRYESSSLSYVTTYVILTGGRTAGPVFPPYNREAPRPSGAAASAFEVWDPDTQAAPDSIAATTPPPGPAPQPGAGGGGGTTPGNVPVPTGTPPAVVAGPKRYLGMTVPQLLLVTAAVVAGGAVAYTVMKKKDPKDPKEHAGDHARSNPYALPSGYGPPARDNAYGRRNPYAASLPSSYDGVDLSVPHQVPAYALPPGYNR